MNGLTIFGLFAVTMMLVFYALEARSGFYALPFAVACALGSSYGFLQGSWPFGMVEAIWSLVALTRWVRRIPPEVKLADALETSPRGKTSVHDCT
jgi:hypothetical protein